MPIRINLMAEAQAVEEARRRNPVKLGIWVAGFLVAVVALWGLEKRLEIYNANAVYAGLKAQMDANAKKYAAVTNAEANIAGIQAKIAALDRLHTNRFLWGPVLNALQYTVVDQIQVTHVWALQTFEREAPRTVQNKTVPGTANFERVKLSIAGRDYSPSTEGYKKYEDALNHYEFFSKQMGGREGFTIDGAPGPKLQEAPGSSREYRIFTLTNQFPEIRREDK